MFNEALSLGTLPMTLRQASISVLARKDKDQTGFIQGQHSYSNLRKLFNVVHSARSTSPEVVISLDAEKAFDRVE